MLRPNHLLNLVVAASLMLSACNSLEIAPRPQVQAIPEQEQPTKTLPAPTPGPTTTPQPTEPPQFFPIRLAWFYKPPADGDFGLIARNFNFYIMSKGDEPERDSLIALGAPRPVLEYIRFDAIMDPQSCTRDPWQNNVAFYAGDYCNISQQHPDWFLIDQFGQRYYRDTSGERFVLMDPGNPGWRNFFLERIKQIQDSDPNWGGVFLDNVDVTFSRREGGDSLPVNYPDESSFQSKVQGFLEFLYKGYFGPSGRLLFGNIIDRRSASEWLSNLAYLDGSMYEGWAIDWPEGYRPVKIWEKHMDLAERTQAMGKYIILVSQGNQNDFELQEFAFASYLLIDHGKAAFRFANSQNYNQAWLYDNYSIKLGNALGTRFRLGKAWRRNFTNGFVQVNPETHEVHIQLNELIP
ncbi:MAG TPA: putative glycoside hydrolase [Anaerolineales bacterium]|jgi:hypothetical protein